MIHEVPATRISAEVALPSALFDVALIDAKACADTGSVSVSLWLREVRAGRAPQPAIRESRLTRWTISSVRDYWVNRIANAQTNAQAAEVVMTRAKKASAAAKEKRQARHASSVTEAT